MARTESDPAPRRYTRIKTIALGALVGTLWGMVMWTLVARDSGGRGFAYLAITMAMIGVGVAAVFGAGAARKQGERVTPRIRLPFRRR